MTDSHREPTSSTTQGSSPDAAIAGRDSAFQTLHVDHVQGDLLNLYERIACEKGRVEIVDANGGCACVLISKAELDTLETALAVLSDGDGVRSMQNSLAQLLASFASPAPQA